MADSLREWRAGWPVLLGAILGMGAGISRFGNVDGLFVMPLAAEFGWGRSQVSLAALAVLGAALAMPTAGMLADREGPRLLILVGAIEFAAAYAALSAIPGQLWVYYYAIAVFIGLAAGPAPAPLAQLRPQASAFSASRRLALAPSMGAPNDWRAGYAAMAPLTLLRGLAAFLVLRGATPTPALDTRSPPRDFAARIQREALGNMRCRRLLASMIVGRLGAGSALEKRWSRAGSRGRGGAVGADCRDVAGTWRRAVHGAAGPPRIPVGTFDRDRGRHARFVRRAVFGLKRSGAKFRMPGLFLGHSVAAGGVSADFVCDRVGDYHPMLKMGSVLAAVSALCLLASGLAKGRPDRPGPHLTLEPAATR